MAATQTVPQLTQDRNFPKEITPQRGVVTLFGYGIQVHVERGHLILKDGIGPDRREARFPRVGHGLKRVIVIGADGMVSLAAIRWLADQDASFIMLDRDGSVLATTGPVRPSDARLRRAQALAHQSGVGLRIVRELVRQKLVGQEQLARNMLNDATAAQTITRAWEAISNADTIPAIRVLESQAALAYWSAWRSLPIMFPKKDVDRVPNHWRTFGTRISPLTGSPRLAVNPPNAILNYLYAVLESEARLAAAALGLDPGLGVMHFDSSKRDSLACDLMEPVRPQVDAYVLDWICQEPLRREWLFEQRDGNCRLMAPFAVRLAETAPTWGRAVAPLAEWVSRTLWSTMRRAARRPYPATRLTQRRRSLAKGGSGGVSMLTAPQPQHLCQTCGKPIERKHKQCSRCSRVSSKGTFKDVARQGRIAAHSAEAEARRAETQRKHRTAEQAWTPSTLPEWLNESAYRARIQPRLAEVTISSIAAALGVSGGYAAAIRAGLRIPHARHWRTLAHLASIMASGKS